MSPTTISAIINQATLDRTTEELGSTWSSTESSMKLVTKQGPFHFTGENSEIPSTISALIDASNERLLISIQNFSDASIIQATERALERSVRVYIIADSIGFGSMLKDPSCNALLGNVLLREKELLALL